LYEQVLILVEGANSVDFKDEEDNKFYDLLLFTQAWHSPGNPIEAPDETRKQPTQTIQIQIQTFYFKGLNYMQSVFRTQPNGLNIVDTFQPSSLIDSFFENRDPYFFSSLR
jgi:hypothetical protein